ncbi:hypothetical protein P885DRAFT_31790 [Corynascus similis CBS 632.67]
MTEIITYSQKHHFKGSFPRLLAPAPSFPAPKIPSSPNRAMAYHDEGYYGAPAPPRQPLEMRSSSVSSSVSSSSSSATCSVPYSTVPSAHVGIARTVSPTANTSDSGTGPVVYSRHPYPTLAHEQPFTFRAHPLPSQLLQAQNPSPLSLYPSSSFQPPRQVSRPSPYGGYSVDNLHHQPPFFSYETWHPMFASSTPSHPPPSSIPSRPRSNDENWFLNGMRRLPPEVVHRIQKYVTWYHCWKATKICKWFLHNFHPDNFHHELKVAQILNTERNRGSAPSDEDFTDVAEPKKPGKEFEFFACYHCFRFKGFDRFEAQKHTTSVFRGEDDFEEDSGTTSSSTATAKREKSFTPSSSRSPSANPHYDPTLTRSSLRASSSSTTGRGCRATATATSSATSPAASGDLLAHMHPRTKRTYGQRRFCVDCGLKAGFYEPGDLIELQKPRKKGDAMWVCRCKKLHSRMDGAQCHDCNSIAPLSVPR